MIEQFVLLVHILVVGYWLGSELVINSTFRYVCRSSAMAFEERARLMDHVMVVDQHVRYALILQASLGTALAAWLGYLPGGGTLAATALAAGSVWLGFVEAVHRLRHQKLGQRFATIDRWIRVGLAAGLVLVAVFALTGTITLTSWLALKLFLFAGVITCGLVIRLYLLRFFRLWADIKAQGSDDAKEACIRDTYMRATATLVILWLFIGFMVWLSFAKALPLT